MSEENVIQDAYDFWKKLWNGKTYIDYLKECNGDRNGVSVGIHEDDFAKLSDEEKDKFLKNVNIRVTTQGERILYGPTVPNPFFGRYDVKKLKIIVLGKNPGMDLSIKEHDDEKIKCCQKEIKNAEKRKETLKKKSAIEKRDNEINKAQNEINEIENGKAGVVYQRQKILESIRGESEFFPWSEEKTWHKKNFFSKSGELGIDKDEIFLLEFFPYQTKNKTGIPEKYVKIDDDEFLPSQEHNFAIFFDILNSIDENDEFPIFVVRDPELWEKLIEKRNKNDDKLVEKFKERAYITKKGNLQLNFDNLIKYKTSEEDKDYLKELFHKN